MKKCIAMILALAAVFSLCACTKEAPAEPTTVPATAATEAPTTAPTTLPTEPPEPEWEPGQVRGEGVGLLWKTYQRGDKVTVIGIWGGYYVIEDEGRDHLVEQRFVRLSAEEAPETDDGYAKSKTEVFTTAYLTGEAIATLGLNTKVEVLDTKGGWSYIRWAEGEGYTKADQISPWYMNTNKSSSSDSGSSGGGSSSGGGGGGGGSRDGSDVDLGALSAKGSGYYLTLLGTYSGPEYEKLEKTEGTVLSNETEGYMAVLRRGDEMKVTQVGETECTVYVDGMEIKVPRWALKMEGDAEYEGWLSYARYKTKAYSDHLMTQEVASFKTNQRVEVIDELTEQELYIVQLEEGGIAYVPMKGLQKYAISSGGGSKSDSGSSGGGSSSGGGGGGGGGGAEWTPPVL